MFAGRAQPEGLIESSRRSPGVEWGATSGGKCKRVDAPREGCQKIRVIMGSTFYSLHYHIVFSTKERRPFLRSEWRARSRIYDPKYLL
jgi:hypothetical protein